MCYAIYYSTESTTASRKSCSLRLEGMKLHGVYDRQPRGVNCRSTPRMRFETPRVIKKSLLEARFGKEVMRKKAQLVTRSVR